MSLDFLLQRFHDLPATRSLIERLPSPGKRMGVGGLPGSSPAVLVATLARALPQRVFTVVAPTPADGERWLADLQTLLDQTRRRCIHSANRSVPRSRITSSRASASRPRGPAARGGARPDHDGACECGANGGTGGSGAGAARDR